MVNNNLNLQSKVAEVEDYLQSPEQMLGKGLDQPFNCSNSGARKILYSTQKSHTVPLKYAEVPYVQTGYENRYGDRSSSIIKLESDQVLIAKIPKFSFCPNQHYYAIFMDPKTHIYSMHERIEYEHITECYGYLYNNKAIDSINIGDTVNAGTPIRMSTSYDEYGNRKDGVNLLCAYMATDKNMEDSMIFSQSAAKKMTTTLLKKISIVLNDNDIPLNIYGKDGIYKSFPDIGEEVKGGILLSTRRENSEDALFTQSYNRLQEIMMSDDKFTVEGTVVDIDIRCNNPQILDKFYNVQLKKYRDELIRLANDITSLVNRIKAEDPQATFSYELKKFNSYLFKVLSGYQYIKEDKIFTNTVIDIVVLHEKPLEVGDKGADRFGGKGVVSFILPDYLMPRNQFGEIIDVIINQSTCINRENPGQLFEMSLNHIIRDIINFISLNVLSIDESFKLIYDYLSVVSPEEGTALNEFVCRLTEDEQAYYLDSIIRDGMLYTSVRPISDNMTLDKLGKLYSLFPWIAQDTLIVPMVDSNGNIRYIPARRKIVTGKKYMYRLKQYSEDKFSSTSMSATNIKNLNTRSKNSKNYRSLHPNTPIAMGSMEIDDLSSLGMEYVITNLMIHSVSPQARRLCEQMITGDPFSVNVQLNEDSSNRSVEILNAYLKAKGVRLKFSKKLKKKKPLVTFDMVSFNKNSHQEDIVKFINKDETFDYNKYYERAKKIEDARKKLLVQFDLVSFEQ